MNIKPFIEKQKERENRNHYVVNIMMVALFTLVILFTLFGGVNVDVGSVYKGDNKKQVVKQSFFMLADTAMSAFMTEEEAKLYVDEVNNTLKYDYGVLPPSYDPISVGSVTDNPYNNLDLSDYLTYAKGEMGKDINKINWMKYKLALAKVLSNPNSDAHKASWDGHMAIALAGQTIFSFLIRVAIITISLVFLVFAVIALIKKKEYKKAKLSLMLLLICFFTSIFYSFNLIRPNWAGIMVMILIPLVTILYSLIRHAMMDERDFSLTMFIHNGVLLLGLIISLILMVCPLFKVTDDFGNGGRYGFAFLFDLMLGEGSYMAVPMSYFIQLFLSSVFLMMHVILNIILILLVVSRFISADYQHNDKKVFLTATLVVNVLLYLLIGVSSLNSSLTISSLGLKATANAFVLIVQPLILGGLIAFEYLYKVKPIKKELILVDKK